MKSKLEDFLKTNFTKKSKTFQKSKNLREDVFIDYLLRKKFKISTKEELFSSNEQHKSFD